MDNKITVKLDTTIPSWSSPHCQYQIIQLLENFKSVKKILDLGTMLGAYAVGFAKTFPSAKIVAVDRWKGESCGLGNFLNTELNFKKFTQRYKNISGLKINYTDLNQIKQLSTDFNFVYFGGPIQENCYQLLSHFDRHCMFAGCMYVASECEPPLSHVQKCRITSDRIQLKNSLIIAAKQLRRDLIPFGLL